MKKILSLLLSFTIGFLGLVSLGVGPARAQTVASVTPLSKLREQYERLFAIEHDPSTSPEVREVNHTILEERRAQLAEALHKRIDALRVYRTNLVTTLTAEEKSAVEGSIQQLVDELQSLQPPRDTSPAEDARPSRRPLKATQNRQVIQQASFGGDAEKSDDRAAEKSAEPPPAPVVKPAAKAAPIEITSPDRDKTVHVGEVEMEVSVNDEDVDNLMVAVYTPASEKPKSARTLELKRSDKGTKTFTISLSKGDNRVEVSDLRRSEVKAERNITFTPADAPSIGSTVANMSASTSAAAFQTVNGNSACQKGIVDINLAAGAPVTGPLTITVTMNVNGKAKTVDTRTVDLQYGVTSYKQPVYLAVGNNTITVTDANGGAVGAALTLAGVDCPSRPGHLVGLLLGGAVMSQQGENFSQADPFLGFIAGYDHTPKHNGGALHWRVQGIFQVQPKKEEAPVASASPTASPSPTPAPTPSASPTPVPFLSSDLPFLASRKTFDIDMHIWYDWPARHLIFFNGEHNKEVRIGPYAAVGASTFIGKNELKGDQDVKIKDPTNSSNEIKLDPTKAKIDNDLKHYEEFGMIGNFFRFNNEKPELFMQAIVAYGRYESMEGFNPGKTGFLNDSRNRFIGKLRIFPHFLDTAPDGTADSSPMFGVEINAGRGPDQIKFFTGIATAFRLFKKP